MSLKEYRQKRDFKHTSEPAGTKAARRKERIFVVQHHQASHDHDDFRLELGGTLKSWAVPKRVSLKSGVRRLAVEVEDHPLSYATFEGTIPKGNYGAGTVELWDAGTWEAEDDPVAGLKKGHLSFALHGSRMKGNWTLVRMADAEGKSPKPQWLLIKKGVARSTRALRVG